MSVDSPLKLSHRSAELGTENAFVVLAEVTELIRQGRDILSFCIGQPDFPTPVNIQDAAIRAVREGRHGYTPSAGIAELRQAAADYMGRIRGLSISPEDCAEPVRRAWDNSSGVARLEAVPV